MRQKNCLLYTSDAADEEDSVDLGDRRNIKKKKRKEYLDLSLIQKAEQARDKDTLEYKREKEIEDKQSPL